MKPVEMFVDEISGRQFPTAEEATASEDMFRDIQNTFAFYTPPDDRRYADGTKSFVNGDFSVPRTKEFYTKLLDALVALVKKYHPGIAKAYYGGAREITGPNIAGYSLLGRYLDDGSSPLYVWWGIQANICPVCYREWGQLYFTNLCCKGEKR